MRRRAFSGLAVRESKRLALTCAVLVAAVAAPTASAGFLPKGLAHKVRAKDDARFSVIVEVAQGKRASAVAQEIQAERAARLAPGVGVRRNFTSVNAFAAELTGKEILRLAARKDVFAITEDAPLGVTSLPSLSSPTLPSTSTPTLSTKQRWPHVSGVVKTWAGFSNGTIKAPTIAIVDSGVDASRADFGGRVVEQVTITERIPNSPGDGRGHGTFVAAIAAGSAPGYAGAAPNAKLVSIDVADDAGIANTRDVIAAADWIIANKARLGIRVANFSLHNSLQSSFRFDPLAHAVERVWFSGVVVVAAAGNYGNAAHGVLHAPGNDPFVITVGATDVDGNTSIRNDFAAPWSAYGYTLDGFAKPDVSAPGRYMVSAVPMTATLALERADRIVEPGYMQLSGTSFAAPVVAGAAAYVLAVHPDWTPSQVKGALMRTARALPSAVPMSAGIGEIFAARAAEMTDPPNPNRALEQFLVADPNGGSLPVFDAASWTDVARSNVAWDAASWTDASWTDASWTDASWTDLSFDMASWTDASWTDSAFASASWTDASWTDASWTDAARTDASWTANAEAEANAAGGEWVTAEELADEVETPTLP
jgi:serine protease AprX